MRRIGQVLMLVDIAMLIEQPPSRSVGEHSFPMLYDTSWLNMGHDNANAHLPTAGPSQRFVSQGEDVYGGAAAVSVD